MNRDSRNGRYTYSDLTRVCRCGHPYGDHLAAAPHGCLAGELGHGPCPCLEFRPRPARRGARDVEQKR